MILQFYLMYDNVSRLDIELKLWRFAYNELVVHTWIVEKKVKFLSKKHDDVRLQRRKSTTFNN